MGAKQVRQKSERTRGLQGQGSSRSHQAKLWRQWEGHDVCWINRYQKKEAKEPRWRWADLSEEKIWTSTPKRLSSHAAEESRRNVKSNQERWNEKQKRTRQDRIRAVSSTIGWFSQASAPLGCLCSQKTNRSIGISRRRIRESSWAQEKARSRMAVSTRE